MSQYTVREITPGSKEIKGKPCQLVKIVLNNEKGDSSYDILKFDKLYSAVAVLNPGDIVEVKKVQNGKFWNLASVVRTGSGDVPAKPTPQAGNSGSKSYSKSPEEQLSIMRQNVNDKASQFVVGLLNAGIYPKKATPDMLFEEVKRFAKKMEAYVSLKDDYSQLSGFATTEDHIDSSMIED